MQPYEAILPLQLKNLKLSMFAMCWQDVEQTAIQNHWGYSQYLSHLASLEMEKREENRLARRIKDACLPRDKTLSSFHFKECHSINPAQINALAESDSWLSKAHNVILFGPSGVGKTHLAAAIGYRQIQLGHPVKFFLTTYLVQQLQQAKAQFRLKDTLIRLDKTPLIILDDIGYVKKNEHETSVLFELICHRYETGSLMITANQPFSQWDSIFPDTSMAVASIDRLVHHATVININEKSYRTKNNQNESL
jgi:DNA replication protein DnaC